MIYLILKHQCIAMIFVLKRKIHSYAVWCIYFLGMNRWIFHNASNNIISKPLKQQTERRKKEIFPHENRPVRLRLYLHGSVLEAALKMQ